MNRLLKGVTIIILLSFMLVISVHADEYTYDELNRLIRVEYETGQVVTYTYDAGGNILTQEVSTPLRLEPIGDKQVDAGQLLEFFVEANGPEGVEVEYSAYNLPEGASFDGATRLFTWRPSSQQVGIYPNIEFRASASGVTASEEITITVNEVNTPSGTGIKFEDEESGLVLYFDNINQGGNTSITLWETLPKGTFFNVSFLPFYFDIYTTAIFTGQVRVTASYDGSGSQLDEENIRLFHFRDDKAVDITTPIDPGPGGNPDTEAKTVSGLTDSFSVFAIGIINQPIVLEVGSEPFEIRTYIPHDVPVVWSSSNTEVATADENGCVIPLAAGAAAITVTTSDGKHSSTYDVLVKPHVNWLPPICMPAFLRDMSDFLVNSKQAFPVKFYLTDAQENTLSQDNVELLVREIDSGELVGTFSLTETGKMQLKLSPQGIYQANVDTKKLNLQLNKRYELVIVVAQVEVGGITIRIKQ